MAAQSKTRQDDAYQRIRADVLAGRLKPGQKLPFAELSESYPFSVGVLREALSRLVEQGLVENEPQRGYFVTPISRPDLLNLTVARREIETLTLRHAMANGDFVWESEVLAAHHRLATTSFNALGDLSRISEEWAEAHSVFHQTLLSGSENPRLTAIATQLRASAELYRRWSLPLGHGESRDIAQEHRAIVDAVLAHDVELAVQLLTDHINLTTNLLLEAGAADPVAADDR
jgi:DNA-binding GntR family transcriptional regulator